MRSSTATLEPVTLAVTRAPFVAVRRIQPPTAELEATPLQPLLHQRHWVGQRVSRLGHCRDKRCPDISAGRIRGKHSRGTENGTNDGLRRRPQLHSLLRRQNPCRAVQLHEANEDGHVEQPPRGLEQVGPSQVFDLYIW